MHNYYTALMLTGTDTIRTYFAKLGLSSEIAELYLALYSFGPQTISELSRNSKVERTRIYRLIDELMNSGLIEMAQSYKKGLIKAAPIAQLRILINQKEQDLASLKDELELIENVLARNSLSSPTTQALFYSGKEGLHRLLWQLTTAKTDVVCLLAEQLVVSDSIFGERWVNGLNQNEIKLRLLQPEAKKQTHFLPKTIKHLSAQSVAPKVLQIDVSQIIWDNSVAFINYADGEPFAHELKNSDIANQLRQLTELARVKSEP